MCMKPDRAEAVVLATCVLHNILRGRNPPRQDEDQEDPVTHELIPAAWRSDPALGGDLPSVTGNTATQSAKAQRNLLKYYCSSPGGSVPWQESMI